MEKIVGFIGLGVMGQSMASHLLKAGYRLHVFTRTKSKAEPLISRGAQWHETAHSLAQACKTIISIVGTPDDVSSLYRGDLGLIQQCQPQSLLIDMTTSTPVLAAQLAEEGSKRRITCLDAPVSGGDKGARSASLSIMVGGSESGYQQALPLFQLMGKNICHLGKSGNGQHAKIVNQLCIAASMVATSEALGYGQGVGLELEKLLPVIRAGAAGSWTLDNLVPRVLEGDLKPGFSIQHFIKDLKIATGSAQSLDLQTPGASLALELYQKMADHGDQSLGTQALYKLFEPAKSQDSV